MPKEENGFETLVEKLFDTLKEKKYILNNEVFTLTVSMSAVVIPEGNDAIHDIQRLLDKKMLEIKSKGKNGFKILGSEQVHEIQYENVDYIKVE